MAHPFLEHVDRDAAERAVPAVGVAQGVGPGWFQASGACRPRLLSPGVVSSPSVVGRAYCTVAGDKGASGKPPFGTGTWAGPTGCHPIGARCRCGARSLGRYSDCSARQMVWRETPKVRATADWDCPRRRSSRAAAVCSGVKALGRLG